MSALRREITRQGGSANVFSLITYCPALRPMLRDARLLDVLRAHPEAFALEHSVSSVTVLGTVAAKKQGRPTVENISTRVRVLEPLAAAPAGGGGAGDGGVAGAGSGSDGSNEAVVAARRVLLLRVQWWLEERAVANAAAAYSGMKPSRRTAAARTS